MKKINLLLAVLVSLTLLNTWVYAVQKTETVEAVYKDIKINLNGEYINLRDTNGNIIEPFIIDGTTYLPVRGVCEALGLNVDWEMATGTVLLEDNGLLTKEKSELHAGETKKVIYCSGCYLAGKK